MLGLVPEKKHAHQRTRRPAHKCKQQENGLGGPPPALFRLYLINAIGKKGDKVNDYQIDY